MRRKLTKCSNVVAYTASTTPPLPYRFKSSNLRFQVPDLGFGSFIQDRRFFRVMSQTATWRALATSFYTVKTWMRRTIWGDRVSSVQGSFSDKILTSTALPPLRRPNNTTPTVARITTQRCPHTERRQRDCGKPTRQCPRHGRTEDQGRDQADWRDWHNTASPYRPVRHCAIRDDQGR
jgi:hypothetical protein